MYKLFFKINHIIVQIKYKNLQFIVTSPAKWNKSCTIDKSRKGK